MKPLGKDAEDLLLDAIDKTAAHVAAGDDPTTAVIKTAEALNLSPGNVNMLVHAYNTGGTSRQLNGTDDTLKKASDFELADPLKAIEALWPTNVKTAAAIANSTVVSTEYAVNPAGMLARRNDLLRKCASRPVAPLAPKPPPLPVDTASLFKQAQGKVQRKKTEVEESRRLKSAAFDKLAARFEDLGQYFVLAGSEPFGWFKKQAELIHGPAASKVCARLVEQVPLLAKQADDKKLRPSRGRPFDLLGQVLDLVFDVNTKQASHEKLVKSAEAFEQDVLRPFAPPRSYVLLDNEKAAFGPVASGMAGGYANNVLSRIANTVSQPNDDAVSGVLKQLTDPQHEANLRNIRLQGLIQDMMTNDDIVSGYPAEEVGGAFNELNLMAPRLAEQPGAMGPLMAKRLQQGRLSDFDVDQMLGSENKLKQRDEVSGGA